MTVELLEDSEMLDEVVVIGYGTMRINGSFLLSNTLPVMASCWAYPLTTPINRRANHINFSIKALKGETLVVSYIGYKTQEILLSSDKTTMTVTERWPRILMDPPPLADLSKPTFKPAVPRSTSCPDEVVVIGYGTMRKKDLTGSVTQVRPDALANEAPRIYGTLAAYTHGSTSFG